MEVIVHAREPYPPHSTIAITKVDRLSYGFMLGRVGQASFAISRADPNVPQAFKLGNLISLERSDDLLLWVGFISERVLADGSAVVPIMAKDHAGALFERGVTPRQWGPRTTSSGQLIREVFQDAQQRAKPPLMVSLPDENGPSLTYQVQSETLLSFLNRVSEVTDWEWGLRHRLLSDSILTELVWQGRMGIDYSGELILEQNVHAINLELTENLDGFIGEALAVGGTGLFRNREFSSVSAGSSQQPLDEKAPTPSSPAQDGTRVVIQQQVSDKPSLERTARREHRSPEFVREALEFALLTTQVDMNKIDIGNRISMRYTDLALGASVERIVRLTAMSLGQNDVIECVADVLRERSFAEEVKR